MIYLDHAATTLQKPPVVGQAMLAALQTAGNPGRGAHEPTLHAARIVYDTRTIDTISGYFSCSICARSLFLGDTTICRFSIPLSQNPVTTDVVMIPVPINPSFINFYPLFLLSVYPKFFQTIPSELS